MNGLAIIAVVAAIIGLVVAVGLASWISKADEGNRPDEGNRGIHPRRRDGVPGQRVQGHGDRYRSPVLADRILYRAGSRGILYVCGALLSVLAGFFGMKVATLGNVRTAYAAEESGMNKALKIAFRSGAVMGLAVTGLGLFRSGRGSVRTGSDNSGRMCNRLWSGSFLHGSVRKSWRRYLHEGC